MKYGFFSFVFMAFIALLFGTLGAQTIHAQALPSSIQGIEIILSNETPLPGEIINAHVESYSTDLNAANITWTVNGAVQEKGIGATAVQIQAPVLGKKLTIAVNAVSSDGRVFSNSMTINSGSVDLILETDGYRQPFFDGKIDLVYQNSYRIIAVPHLMDSSGKEVASKNLIYTWKKDSKIIQDQNGYGKQIFSWKEEIVPRERIINVLVTSRDGTLQASKALKISASSPILTFYQDDPLYGPLYNVALSGVVNLGKSGETSILAVPYGFNLSKSSSPLSYTWMVNSIKQTGLETSQSIVLRAPNNTSGTSDIRLQIKNNNEILQGTEGSFTVNFKPSTQTAETFNAPNYNGI